MVVAKILTNIHPKKAILFPHRNWQRQHRIFQLSNAVAVCSTAQIIPWGAVRWVGSVKIWGIPREFPSTIGIYSNGGFHGGCNRTIEPIYIYMVFPLDLGPAPYHWPSNQLQAVSKGKLCPEPFSGFLQSTTLWQSTAASSTQQIHWSGHWHPIINLLQDTGYSSSQGGPLGITLFPRPWGCGCWHSPPTWTAISDSPRWAETPRLRSGPPDDAPGIHCRHLGSWSKIPSHCAWLKSSDMFVSMTLLPWIIKSMYPPVISWKIPLKWACL